ncbi:MAG: Sporulation-specific protease YabG [Thermoanaerobacterales bacterium 50_218]|nr:MAG: Sporulation-specific protease YabG [Thermoanaerobacterales bacterium 50_218]
MVKKVALMSEIQVGDIVARKSYQNDINFRVEEIQDRGGKKWAMLRGLFVRLYADAPVDDLVKKKPAEVSVLRREFAKKRSAFLRQMLEHQSRTRQRTLMRAKNEGVEVDFFEFPGWVLHFDGDQEYREVCLRTYLQLNVPSQVFYVPEKEQPTLVCKYLKEQRPDILVLTGHDGIYKGARDYRDLRSYRHSEYFLEAIKRARQYEPDRDALVIIAGGCQSYYEALIEAGANFASSPDRVMIHVLDPVFIAEKISYTSIYEKISLSGVLEYTVTGPRGMGGIQTKGKFRLGLPPFRY